LKSYWFVLYNVAACSYGERRLFTHLEVSESNHYNKVNGSNMRWLLDPWRNNVA